MTSPGLQAMGERRPLGPGAPGGDPRGDVLSSWLTSFEASLASLPRSEREDLVAEHRAHLEEIDEPPESVFGVPERYAARFLEAPTSGAVPGAVSGWRRLVRLAASLPALLLLLLGLIFLTTGLAAPFDPESTGLFVEGSALVGLGIGVGDASSTNLLGIWSLPILGGVGLLLSLAGLKLLDWSRRS
ncbi:MAG TPA: hypothetical protein ENK18_09040 [Deltaproteobacteria bacterium]|nr:hypothetical protein [Deltaproteobacteria bacterium]